MILLFLLICLCCSCSRSNLTAVKGVLDLSGYDLEQNGNINLNGEWEFYRQQFIPPGGFNKAPMQPAYVTVPSGWTKYRFNDGPMPGSGYGTFRLLVKLDSDHKHL